MNVTFARKIQQLRKSKGWTIFDLAREIGTTPGYISKIEARGEIPSPKTVVKLARALQVDTGKLLDLAKEEKIEEIKKNIIERYEKFEKEFK